VARGAVLDSCFLNLFGVASETSAAKLKEFGYRLAHDADGRCSVVDHRDIQCVVRWHLFSPENLYNVAQQTAVVGILATVMVLVIVTRNIDLSVGSVLGFVGVLIAFLIYTLNWSWPAACLAGFAAAIAVALYQGALTSYVGVPSFVVTLGGLMSFRGASFMVANGKTQPLTDEFFLSLGGGYNGGLGTTVSWHSAR